MDELRSKRINELHDIIRKHYFEYITQVQCGAGSGDGHSFDDMPEYVDQKVSGESYKHPWNARRKARKELRRMMQEGEEEENGLILKILESDRIVRRRSFLRGVARTAGVVGSLAVIAGMIYFGATRSSKKEEKVYPPHPYVIGQNMSIRKMNLESIEYQRKHNLPINGSYLRSYENFDKLVKEDAEKVRKSIEQGYLTPSHPDYKSYKEIFGKEQWWNESEKGNK